MHRDHLLALLADYRARYPAEDATAARFTRFVQAHAGCFERSLPGGHVTGSAWLVNPKGSHVLLTHHRKLGIWVQLGGHADGSTDVLGVALREAMEESGITAITALSETIFDLDIHRIPAARPGGEPGHYHYDVRFALRATDEDYRVSDESHALAWVEIAAIADITREASMLRMARKWLDRWRAGTIPAGPAAHPAGILP